MTEHVEDIDRGWNKIKRDMAAAALDDLVVDVGIVGKDADTERGEWKIWTAATRITNALIGLIHEYGAPKADIFERSFIRATIDEKHSAIDRLFMRVARGIVGGKVAARKGLGLVGEKVVAWIKAGIRMGIPPPLSDVTIAAKGSSKPLVDTSQLVGSITHVVRGAGEGEK